MQAKRRGGETYSSAHTFLNTSLTLNINKNQVYSLLYERYSAQPQHEVALRVLNTQGQSQ